MLLGQVASLPGCCQTASAIASRVDQSRSMRRKLQSTQYVEHLPEDTPTGFAASERKPRCAIEAWWEPINRTTSSDLDALRTWTLGWFRPPDMQLTYCLASTHESQVGVVAD